LAMRFVLSTPGVTSVLTGVDSIAQIHQNIALFDKGELDEDLRKAITEAIPQLPERLLNPANWPNA